MYKETLDDKLIQPDSNKQCREITPAHAMIPALLAVILLATSLTLVPTGYIGIVTTFGVIEEDRLALSEGWNFVLPWQKVHDISCRPQQCHIRASTAESMAISSDLCPIGFAVVIDWQIDKSAAWKFVDNIENPNDWGKRILEPCAKTAVRNVIATYLLEEIIQNPEDVRRDIDLHIRKLVNELLSGGSGPLVYEEDTRFASTIQFNRVTVIIEASFPEQ